MTLIVAIVSLISGVTGLLILYKKIMKEMDRFHNQVTEEQKRTEQTLARIIT